MDPIIEQIARAREIQPHFFRIMRDHLVQVVQPQLDELATVKAENAELRAALEGKRRKGGAA